MDFGNYKKDKNARYAIKNDAEYFVFISDEDICNPTKCGRYDQSQQRTINN